MSSSSGNTKEEEKDESLDPASCSPSSDCNKSVPQIPGITEGDLKTAIRVLDAVASLKKKRKRKRQEDKDDREEGDDDCLKKFKAPNLRPFRKALAGCLELQTMSMYEGKGELEHYEKRKAERSLKRQKTAEAAQNQKYIESAALRRGRVEKLKVLQKAEGREEEQAKLLAYLVPDGHVELTPALLANSESRGESATKTLPKLRSCYVCKKRYRHLHHFYDQLCETCAPFNWEKRHQSVNMTGKVAVVTGARIKIGYQVCLKLLRAGCTVVATTRFPNAAAGSYQSEPDFNEWKDRLHVYGLDLRDITGIEAFCRFLRLKYAQAGIDVVVHNACQTIRRPRAYYLPMMEKERHYWEKGNADFRAILQGSSEFERIRRRLVLGSSSTPMLGAEGPSRSASAAVAEDSHDSASDSVVKASPSSATTSSNSNNTMEVPYHTSGISHSAAMSQMIILPEDVGVSSDVLPTGMSDINGQQLDLRQTNSWLLKMEEVSTPEVMECMFVNAMAPFVLNSRLKPLLTMPDSDERADRFIVNVSAMEGKFNRYKTPNHPHTNMAKAALNMMTRTSAEDWAKRFRIYMNAVDTGWINDENPLEKASKIAKNNRFQTPIDEVDAAARILDPVFVGVKGEAKIYGQFLKDYHESEW